MLELAQRCLTPRSTVAAVLMRAVREIALVSAMWFTYHWGRGVAIGQQATAFANARALHHLEVVLRLPSEASVQALVGSDSLLKLANYYYVGVHFPVSVAFLVYGLIFRPFSEYRWARNVMAIQTGLALIIQVLVPLAPPRMFPQWGFTDTMTALGPSAYGGALGAAANQFAAMPSLHIAWALWSGLTIFMCARRLWVRVLGLCYPLATLTVIIGTANHFLLDAVGGAVIFLAAIGIQAGCTVLWRRHKARCEARSADPATTATETARAAEPAQP